MKEINIERKFQYNSVTLPDPNPNLGADQVREFYAAQYGELNNAVVEGPVTKSGVATYTFTRAAGAKGAAAKMKSAEQVVADTLAGPAVAKPDALLQHALAGKDASWATAIARVAGATQAQGAAMPLPGTAFGLWG